MPGYALSLPQTLTGLPGTIPTDAVVTFALGADTVTEFVQSLRREIGQFSPSAHIIVQTHRGKDYQKWYSNNFPTAAAVPGRRQA